MTERACSSPLAVLAEADACDTSTCRFHLPRDAGHHCALEWAERGGMDREDVAAVLGVSRERVRQIEEEALSRRAVRALVRRFGLDPDDFEHADPFERAPIGP